VTGSDGDVRCTSTRPIRAPLMGGEWGRAIGTVPRTPQAPGRPPLGGAARDYVETVSPSGTAAWWHNKKKYIYIYYKNNIKNEIILLIIYNII
jgi:hypothetical protein